MLNKIVRAVTKYDLEEGTGDDTKQLVDILRKYYVDEAINEMIDNNQWIIIASKYFVKIGPGTFTLFAELLGSSSRLQWHAPYVADLQRQAGYSDREMMDIIKDLIIRNDLIATNI